MRSLIVVQMNVALTRFPLPTRRQLSVRSPPCLPPAAIGLEVGTIPIVWPAALRRESAARGHPFMTSVPRGGRGVVEKRTK